MIEAMACGTPVIAYPYGSVPEIMKEGVSGFIVPDAQSAAAAIKNVDNVDRKKCREYFEKRFTSTRMAEDYLAIYDRLIKGQAAPIPHSEGALSWTKSA
jgi:glycosyltransferase involved in cell wall biosynthesis